MVRHRKDVYIPQRHDVFDPKLKYKKGFQLKSNKPQNLYSILSKKWSLYLQIVDKGRKSGIFFAILQFYYSLYDGIYY